jgi:hypothetical protein
MESGDALEEGFETVSTSPLTLAPGSKETGGDAVATSAVPPPAGVTVKETGSPVALLLSCKTSCAASPVPPNVPDEELKAREPTRLPPT